MVYLILYGYMGSGKSTIGKLIAKELQFNFIDLDEYIEIQENKSISDIFEEKGVVYFRKKESQYLKEVLNKEPYIVLSLGGGTPCQQGNLDYLQNLPKGVKTVYLNASPQTLTNRLFPERSKRPIIANINKQEALLEFIAKHLFERNPYYRTAQHILSTDEKNINQIIEELYKLCRSGQKKNVDS